MGHVDMGHRVTRPAVAATALTVVAVAVSACGGSRKPRAIRAVATAATSVAHTPQLDANEVLSLAGLGTFEGRCPRGAGSWTLRFVDDAEANEAISYRVGHGARRTMKIDPGKAIAVRLVPNATRTHEPPARSGTPIGQGRGRTTAAWVPTTAPLQAIIYQGTEPQILRADVHLALTTIGGESGQCILVGSTVKAYDYPN